MAKKSSNVPVAEIPEPEPVAEIPEPEPVAEIPEPAIVEVVEPKKAKKDKPPNRKAKAARKRRAGKGPTYNQLREGLEAVVSMVGLGVKMAGDDYCGDRILVGGPALTDSVIELSKQNPRVKEMLGSLTRTSAWGGVIIASAAIALPILSHHGIIPRSIAGIMGAPLEPVGVEAGGTHNADWPNGAGQDDPSPSDPTASELLGGVRVEAAGFPTQ